MDYFPLRSFANYVDAHIVLGRLRDEGIDCWLRNENTTTIMPVWTTATGGIELMVAGKQVHRTQELLAAFDAERKQHHPCPACGSADVVFINTVRKPVNWLSAALSFFLTDLAVMPEQRYHCFACGKEWEAEAADNQSNG